MLALILSLLTGCVNSNDLIDVEENAAPLTEVVPFDDFNIDDELVGVWQYDLTHLDIFLIFNADGTGAERQGSYRAFAWTTENGYLIMDGGLDGKFLYFLTDSIDGITLTLTGVESGNINHFYCVATSYGRCCCVRIARNYFFGTLLEEDVE
jgi:hypothetical protein